MQKGLIRKGLVCSVIILFITVGVQPVFAGVSITTTLDKDEDCIECQVSDGYSLLRVKLLLVRLKIIINIISLVIDEDEVLSLLESIHITKPELLDSLENIIENDGKLLERNTKIRELNNEFICSILLNGIEGCIFVAGILNLILDQFEGTPFYLFVLAALTPVFMSFGALALTLTVLYYDYYDCFSGPE